MTDARPPTLAAVRRGVKALADPGRARSSQRYFKTGAGEYGEGDRFIGLTAPQLHELSRTFQDLDAAAVASLLRSTWHEERSLALLILVRQYRSADLARRAAIHRLYLRHLAHVDNWDLVDCSAAALVGAHVRGRDRALLTRLASSARLWDRRIAIVATHHDIRRGDFAWTLRIARLLLDDREDLIHKAVGWMLREVGKRERAVAERFLDRHAARMPRTMLRYAIERFPSPLRAKYLSAGRRRGGNAAAAKPA